VSQFRRAGPSAFPLRRPAFPNGYRGERALPAPFAISAHLLTGCIGERNRHLKPSNPPLRRQRIPPKPTPVTLPPTLPPKPSPPAVTATLPPYPTPQTPTPPGTPTAVPTPRATITPPAPGTPTAVPTPSGPLPPGLEGCVWRN